MNHEIEEKLKEDYDLQEKKPGTSGTMEEGKESNNPTVQEINGVGDLVNSGFGLGRAADKYIINIY